MDVFTDGKFIELPNVSIFDDCEAWDTILLAGYEWLAYTNQIVGDDTAIEYARNDLIAWLADANCAQYDTQTVLFADRYDVDQAAPLTSPRPGNIGESILIQSDGGSFKTSIGQMQVATTTATSGFNKLKQTVNAIFAREVGLAVKIGFRKEVSTAGDLRFGFSWTGDTLNRGATFRFQSANIRVFDETAQGIANGTLVLGTQYTFAVVLQSTRHFFLIKGGVYATWTLFWVGTAFNDNDSIVAHHDHFTPHVPDALDDFTVARLRGAWAINDGIATDKLPGSIVAGSTFIHTEDFVLSFNVGTVSATQKVIKFRVQDSSNYWQVTIDSTSTDLDEVVAGFPTQRGSGVVLASDAYALLIAEGTSIKLFSTNVSYFNYGGAINYQTETDGEFASGADISDLATYPRTFAAGSAPAIRLDTL